MKEIILLGFAIIAEIVATTSLKLSDGFTKWIPSTAVVIGYAVSFQLFSMVLKKLPLGTMYAIWAGLGTAGTVAVGVWLFKETLDLPRIIGIGLILAGVVLLNFVGKGH